MKSPTGPTKNSTKKRSAADLRARVHQPGYTPALRDLAALVDLLAADDENDAEAAARSIVRLDKSATMRLVAATTDPRPLVRARILDAIAQIDPAAGVEPAARLLGDADTRVRRRAIAALGRCAADVNADRATAEAALLAAWEPASPPHRRAIAEALGKMGGDAARAFLLQKSTNGQPDTDAELLRIVSQARVRLERDEVRTEPTTLVGDRGLLDSKESTFALLYMTRRGLEPLVTEELAARGTFGARIVGEGRVSIPWKGTLDAAMAAARTAFALALPLAPVQIDKSAAGDANDRVARAVVQALTSDEAKARFLSFTRGPVRFRLSFAQGGHRRALVWKISGALAANPQTSWLVNDATDAPWDATVREEGEPGEGFVHVELRPRALTDTRFAYRTGDVPAASHPPLAAALARVAGVREDDVVWDPFVGSGTELVERAKLGPYARLIGSDRDAAAVEVARQNVQMANVDRVTLLRADVFERTPEGVTVILTNPPMGRRVTGDLDLSTLLDRFILTAASVLKKPGSRLVWISPQPKRTRGRAEAEGLKLARALMVDMGGFDAEIQRFDRL